ncbi:hypothetical protein GCM10012320_22070 [Sinomonas cellulolyticus]|uniref:Transposase DDE domain-containing protein n=1 Tax=Sinomonas cellulolyticus TaxID=2801916 RepID=A0ABS1K2F6_9MICC|nr:MULTISPECIES: hypothetical protein [Sinomonas]MBL0705715.1 hypothetical protein [Sinomonas cellulolyticus]GHG52090.1 hypothetical protein GCM10012320_22070 [Sinomonas sp. KCTC 49339]
MSVLPVSVWLACGYGLFLLVVAHLLDLFARRAAVGAARRQAGGFTYHADHDAWLCPQDQWLWPESFDPNHRVMRYRASPTVCNSCPVKDTCTTSRSGRQISRNIDQWPSSEAERFHRTVACTVAVLGLLWPLVTMLTVDDALPLLVLGATVAVVAAGAWPLFGHLRRTPVAFPDHVPQRSLDEDAAERLRLTRREERRHSGFASDRRAPGTPFGDQRKD